jgi:hypothetical protein
MVSNSTFDRGSVSPAYVKPFDELAKESETGDWLLGLDSNQQPPVDSRNAVSVGFGQHFAFRIPRYPFNAAPLMHPQPSTGLLPTQSAVWKLLMCKE